MDINKAFTILLMPEFEGAGFSNIKQDKGGPTKYGIAQADNPGVDIKDLTEDQAKVIYDRKYWGAGACAEKPPQLQYIHFDTCVNLGVAEAEKIYQFCQVHSCVNATGYISRRHDVYKMIEARDPADKIFDKDWMGRLKSLQDFAAAGKLV